MSRYDVARIGIILILALLLFVGCATPRAPFAHSDSGRMGVQLYRSQVPVKSEFEHLVSTHTFTACVSFSTSGVAVPCADN